jgi:hypothetical protein
MHRSFEVEPTSPLDLEATQYIPIHLDEEESIMHEPAPSSTPLVDPTDNRTDPLVVRGIVVAIAASALSVAAAFGLHLTKTQDAALLGFVGLVGPMLVAWWARKHVFSPATVNKVLAAARIRRP